MSYIKFLCHLDEAHNTGDEWPQRRIVRIFSELIRGHLVKRLSMVNSTSVPSMMIYALSVKKSWLPSRWPYCSTGLICNISGSQESFSKRLRYQGTRLGFLTGQKSSSEKSSDTVLLRILNLNSNTDIFPSCGLENGIVCLFPPFPFLCRDLISLLVG